VYALYADMIHSACVDQASIAGQYHEQDTRLLHLPKHLAAKYLLRVSVSTSTMPLSDPWNQEPQSIILIIGVILVIRLYRNLPV
jgi:hypothetical protein